MTGWAPVALTAAVAVVLTLPSPADLRLRAVLPRPDRAGRDRPGASGIRRRRVGPGVPACRRPWRRERRSGWALGPGGAVAGLAVGVLRGAGTAARAARPRRGPPSGSAAVEACTALAAELRAGRAAGRRPRRLRAAGPGPVPSGAAPGRGGSPAGRRRRQRRCASRTAGGSAVPEVLRGLAACWQVCSTGGRRARRPPSTGSPRACAPRRAQRARGSRRARRTAGVRPAAGPAAAGRHRPGRRRSAPTRCTCCSTRRWATVCLLGGPGAGRPGGCGGPDGSPTARRARGDGAVGQRCPGRPRARARCRP